MRSQSELSSDNELPAALPGTKPFARIAPVPASPDEPVVAAIFARIRARGVEPLNMHRVVANAPNAFKAFFDTAWALRDGSEVPRTFRELAILRACHLAGGDYEIAQHVPMAIRIGLSAEQVGAVADWQASPLFDAAQQAVLAYADGMVGAGPANVTDEVFAELQRHIGPREIVELTMTIAFYQASAGITRALGVTLEDRTLPREVTYGV